MGVGVEFEKLVTCRLRVARGRGLESAYVFLRPCTSSIHSRNRQIGVGVSRFVDFTSLRHF